MPRRLVGHGKLFALKVKKDSMTGAAITDGDLVVVRQQPVAENGEIVAAQLDETATAEATVKTLHRVNGHVWLMPATPAYQPICRFSSDLASDTPLTRDSSIPGAGQFHPHVMSRRERLL